MACTWHPSRHCRVYVRISRVRVRRTMRRTAEVVIQGRHHLKVEAHDEEDRIQVALEKTFEKAERQLRRVRDKVTDHHRA